MEIDDSVKNRSNIATGALIMSVIAIFVAFALVFGGSNTHSEKGVCPTGNGIPYGLGNNNSEFISEDIPNISRGSDDVPLSEVGPAVDKDTQKGTIEVTWEYCGDLDLCISQPVLDMWGDVLKARIKGKYEPIGGTVTLLQDKCQNGGDLTIVWREEPAEHENCYYDIWYGSLLMPDNVDYIELASNQWPDGAHDKGSTCGHIPGKKVHITSDIEYQGCTDEEQKFWKIVTHKNHSTRIPQPPNEIYNFIAGLKAII